MSECNKYNVAAIVYHLARCAFVLGYRLRPCLMRGKWSARIVVLAFINAKVFDVVALEVVHCSIPSLGLRLKYSTFTRDSARQS